MKSGFQRDNFTPTLTANILNSQNVETTQVFIIDEWVKKCGIYIHTQRNTTQFWKKEIFPFATWINLEDINHVKCKPVTRKINCLIPLKWGISNNPTHGRIQSRCHGLGSGRYGELFIAIKFQLLQDNWVIESCVLHRAYLEQHSLVPSTRVQKVGLR